MGPAPSLCLCRFIVCRLLLLPASLVSVPTTFSWTVASSGPVVDIVRQPAPSVGVSVVVFELRAVWASTTNSSLAGAVVSAATFQVQLPGSSSWTSMCSYTDTPGAAVPANTTATAAATATDGGGGPCSGSCTGAGCNYSYALPSSKAAAYTIQFRATLSGAAGDASAASWSYQTAATTRTLTRATAR